MEEEAHLFAQAEDEARRAAQAMQGEARLFAEAEEAARLAAEADADTELRGRKDEDANKREKDGRFGEEQSGAGIEQGTQVMCRYGGGEVKFAGVISAVHSNGTYDVAYEDGDAEHGVLPEMFDVLQPLDVGDLVTCRYGGGEDAFPGKISLVHTDGTYDVAYDDGDSETNVARFLIAPQMKCTS